MANIKTAEKKKHYLSKQTQCYLLLALPLIGFFVFSIYPILWAFAKSVYYYDKNPFNTRFTGIENYVNLFTVDLTYWKAWLTTLKFAAWKLPFEVPLALLIAFMMRNISKKSGTVFRAIFCLPNIISVVIIGVIFSNLFDYFGCINVYLTKIGLIKEPIDWFSKPGSSMFALCVGSVWASIGINILYFTAALANVPDDVYEAAKIDGANGTTTFFKITIPMISPVFQTILLLAINGTVHCGEFVIAYTNGAPGGMTHTVGSYMINTFLPGFAHGTPNIGYGCAMAAVTSLLSALIAVLYSMFTKKMKEVY